MLAGKEVGTGAPAEAAWVLGGNRARSGLCAVGKCDRFQRSPVPSGNRTGICESGLHSEFCLKIKKAETHSREGTRCGCQRPHHHCHFLPARQGGLPFLWGCSHDLAPSPDQLWRGDCWGLNRALQLFRLQQPKSESFPGAA